MRGITFVEVSMFMFAYSRDRSTYVRSRALLWLLASSFVLCICVVADFPRKIKYIRISEIDISTTE